MSYLYPPCQLHPVEQVALGKHDLELPVDVTALLPTTSHNITICMKSIG